MGAALIAMILFICSIVLASEGMWLGIVVFALVAVFLIAGLAVNEAEWEAHCNRREYWAKGGPEQKGRKR